MYLITSGSAVVSLVKVKDTASPDDPMGNFVALIPIS
jgi:hypothetical protein